MTIQELKGRLKGLRLAYVGDGNNVANSLIEAGAKVGMHVVIGCPRAISRINVSSTAPGWMDRLPEPPLRW